MLRRLYPEEIVTLIALPILGLVLQFTGPTIQWYDPLLAFDMFNSLVVPAFIYGVTLFMYEVIRHHHLKIKITTLIAKSFGRGLRVWIIFYLALIIKFNVKMNIGVWRNVLYDPTLYLIDHWLGQGFHWFVQWHHWLDGIYDVTPLYTLFYQMLFLGTFVILSLVSERAFRELFAATIFMLLLGCTGYILWPALGPFLYDAPQSPYMQTVFEHMFARYQLYVSHDGSSYVPAFLTQGLAAMPSLHMANTAVFVYFIWKYARWALIVYLPVAVFIAIEALYTKFHYFLDLIVGLELACIAIILARGVYYWRYGSTGLKIK